MNPWVQEVRPLTTSERALLEAVTSRHHQGKVYVGQVSRVWVVGRCGCGCPTIDLAVDGKREPNRGASEVILDAVGRSPEGIRLDIIVHIRAGELSELELVAHDNSSTYGLPTPEALEWVG